MTGRGASSQLLSLTAAGRCLSELDQLLHDVVYGGPGGCGAARRGGAGGIPGGPPGGGGGYPPKKPWVWAGAGLPFPPGVWGWGAARPPGGPEPAWGGGGGRAGGGDHR